MNTRHRSTPPDAAPASRFSIKRLVVRLAVLCAGLGACVVIMLGLAFAITWPSLPELHAVTNYRPSVPLRIYTADKVLIGEYGVEHRNVLRFDEFPEVMRHAILAAEDSNFYQHTGVDFMGVARATLKNTMRMSASEGASTITMQVARNFYLSSEKTFLRKFYELLFTYKIESELSKDQILELYMNQIYLGHRAYGFSAAARTYFGKPLAEVTPAEAAMLAGLPKAPSAYNPIANLKRATLRQHYVLGRMRTLGYLNEADYQTAMNQPLSIGRADDSPDRVANHGEYPSELARQLVYSVYGDETYSKGLDVYTTIDSKDQRAAYQSVRNGVLDYTRRAAYPGPEGRVELPNGIEKDADAFDDLLDDMRTSHPNSDDLIAGVVLAASPTEVTVALRADNIINITDKKVLAVVARALAPKASDDLRISRGAVVYVRNTGENNWEILNMPALQAALISMAPENGAIKAMVGGFDFSRGKFNRVTQAWRQPGSNIKPFLYAAGLERGLTPSTEISDQPFTMTAAQTGSRAWAPKNDNNRYEPYLTLRQALYRSKNMVSIRIMQAITPEYGREYFSRFGFDKNRWPAVLPIALGAGSATPLQVVNAYSVFANGGYRVAPFLIDRVTDRSGKVLMTAQPEVAGDNAVRAIDPRTAWLMNDILRGVARYGTGARSYRTLKRDDVGGKTGTTNDSVDVWFSGYTPKLATTVWMGFDQPRSLGSTEFGSGLALSAWLDYMQPALKGVPVTPPPTRPEGLLVENGEYYYAEFPPGQSVASLDLPSDESSLDAFLNNARPADGSGMMIRPMDNGLNNSGSTTPAMPANPDGAIPVPQAPPQRGQMPSGNAPPAAQPVPIPAIPVPQ